MSARELNQWFAYWQLEPWGEFRAEVSRALVGSAVCASFGARVKPLDLMPQWDREQKPRGMSAADFKAIAEAHNARLKMTNSEDRGPEQYR